MPRNQIFSLHHSRRFRRLPRNKVVQNWFKKLYKNKIWISFPGTDVVQISGIECSEALYISTYDVLGEEIQRLHFNLEEEYTIQLPDTGVFTLLIKMEEEHYMFGVHIN